MEETFSPFFNFTLGATPRPAPRAAIILLLPGGFFEEVDNRASGGGIEYVGKDGPKFETDTLLRLEPEDMGNGFRLHGSILDGNEHTCAHFGAPRALYAADGSGFHIAHTVEIVLDLKADFVVAAVRLHQNRFLGAIASQRKKLTQPMPGYA